MTQIFLDALAYLDSKLSVSQSVIDVFRLAHLRVFQSYFCYVGFLPYFVLVHPTPSLIFEVVLVHLESFCILQGVGELKVGDGLVGWD